MTTIKLRRDTAANWTTDNPILAEGEVGVDLDTGLFRMGDGVSHWSSLIDYARVDAVQKTAVAMAIALGSS